MACLLQPPIACVIQLTGLCLWSADLPYFYYKSRQSYAFPTIAESHYYLPSRTNDDGKCSLATTGNAEGFLVLFCVNLKVQLVNCFPIFPLCLLHVCFLSGFCNDALYVLMCSSCLIIVFCRNIFSIRFF